MPESVTYVLGMECYPSVRKGTAEMNRPIVESNTRPFIWISPIECPPIIS